jgi:hypothetical protein
MAGEEVMKCSECGEPLAECMGFTHAGDFVQACEGQRPWSEVRQRCWRCVEKKSLKSEPAA